MDHRIDGGAKVRTAVASFHHDQSNLLDTLLRCGPGKVLIRQGFEADVRLSPNFWYNTADDD